jgi:hypothetical protein
MRGRHRKDERHLADGFRRVAAARRPFACRANEQVDPPVEQRLPGARQRFLGNAQPGLVGHCVKRFDIFA